MNILIDKNVSIYRDMYIWGLKQVPLEEIVSACSLAGKDIREKDIKNYYNGYYKSNMYKRDELALEKYVPPKKGYFTTEYDEYPESPFIDKPEPDQRWVPCSADGHPLIKWSTGCMSKVDALSKMGCKTLAENTKGTHMVIIDCDGDHDPKHLEMETVRFLSKYRTVTHTLIKPKFVWDYYENPYDTDPEEWGLIPSFHLTFWTDRVIPTMHFPKAHIDIIGNKANSLRYYKNKIWNHMEPQPMTTEMWNEIRGYIYEREERRG